MDIYVPASICQHECIEAFVISKHKTAVLTEKNKKTEEEKSHFLVCFLIDTILYNVDVLVTLHHLIKQKCSLQEEIDTLMKYSTTQYFT